MVYLQKVYCCLEKWSHCKLCLFFQSIHPPLSSGNFTIKPILHLDHFVVQSFFYSTTFWRLPILHLSLFYSSTIFHLNRFCNWTSFYFNLEPYNDVRPVVQRRLVLVVSRGKCALFWWGGGRINTAILCHTTGRPPTLGGRQ